MVNPVWFLVGGFVAAELYNKYTTPEEKIRGGSSVKSHHGGWGALALLAGLATKRHGLAAIGAGLTLHDIKDAQSG